MAFRQPAYHAPQRVYSAIDEAHVNIQPARPSEQVDEAQEWILFPNVASTTDRTYTTSTQRTRRTTGRSRISDYGSLETAARSYGYEEDGSAYSEAVIEDEDDGELDSLDSHLHEFRADQSVFRELSKDDLNTTGNPVLPTHDGLGSFRINQTTMGEGIQEHLYAFERYNPRRLKRRRESLELGQTALEENERTIEHERIRRIEEWRLEQSRALLQEIRRETGRRKQSMSSEQRNLIYSGVEEEAATLGSVAESELELPEQHLATSGTDNDGFWSRITRRVIQNLMGIDDRLLSILLGEALPEDDAPQLSSTAESPRQTILVPNIIDDSWEYRLLNRIARELGLLVNQLYDHPGAFSTYLQVRQMPLPYAGLPIIPEVVPDTPQDASPPTLAASSPDFRPTIQMPSQPVHISGVMSRSAGVDGTAIGDMDATPRAQCHIHQTFEKQNSSFEFTKDEWEKELDIKMVFRYLRSRFISRSPSHTTFSRDTANLATSSPQDAAARAARVLQHHPLVTRPKSVDRPTFRVVVPGSPILHRRGSSCASQSTRKSARRNSGSSRHYWDINGSVGSGSLIASAGGWGEV